MRASWRVTLILWSVGLLIPGASAQTSRGAGAPSPPILATDAASRFLGGPGFEVQGIEIDAAGNIYVAGNNKTNNADGSFDYHVELYKLNPQFEEVFHLPIAGNRNDQLLASAIDASGNIYLAGLTDSTNFPVVNPVQAQNNGLTDAFLTKVDSDGNILFSTYLGGSLQETLSAMTVDAEGNAFLGGKTRSGNFPSTPGAYMSAFHADLSLYELFVAKIATESPSLEYSTTAFGGDFRDGFYGIAEVAGGDVFLLLHASATEFPTTDNSMNSAYSQLVARLSADGSQLVYASYADTDGLATSLILDGDGNPVVAGATRVATIDPTTNLAISSFTVSSLSGLVASERVVMTRSGNLVGIGSASGPLHDVGNGYPSGSTYVLESSGDGTPLFSTKMPIGAADRAVGTGPNGEIYVGGTSGMVSRILPDQPDALTALPHILGVANAAGPSVTSRIAPGEIVSLYGPWIGSPDAMTTQIGADGLVTTELGGVEVHFNGTKGRLLYTGPLQVNAVAPFAWSQDDSVLVEVFHDGDLWSSISLNPTDTEPGVFLVSGVPRAAAALNQDQTINSPDNPADPGSVVAVFLTGVGEMTGASYQDGEVFDPSTPLADLPVPSLPVYVSTLDLSRSPKYYFDSVAMPLEILYAGQAPASLAGVIQVNLRLPLPDEPPPHFDVLLQKLYLWVDDSGPVSFAIWMAPP